MIAILEGLSEACFGGRSVHIFVARDGLTNIVASVDLIQLVQLVLGHLGVELTNKLLQELLTVLLDALVVLEGVCLIRGVRQGVEHLQVQVNGDVAKPSHDVHDLPLRYGLLKCRVYDVPKLSGLSGIVPVLAEKPADQD